MKKKHILFISIFFIFTLLICNVVYADSTVVSSEDSRAGSKLDIFAENTLDVVYNSHVQNIGWQDEVANGSIAGTTGRNLRLEAINIKLKNAPEDAKLKYSGYVQGIGWQSQVQDGTTIGTVGKELRLEGIKIELENLKGYDIKYRVHIQNIGWTRWVKNGEISGLPGGNLRIEAVQIKLDESSDEANLIYSTYVQNIGWQEEVETSEMAGTTGKSLRLEAIKIDLDNVEQGADIFYRTHIQNIGWTDWSSNGQISGAVGQSLRMEAIQIYVENLEGYTVEYRVHLENLGWTDWVGNMQKAGTTGKSLRLEAIEIRLKKIEGTAHIAYGIDVSKYQENIDWKAVKNSGIDFAMIRAGYRGYEKGTLNVDSYFYQNMNGALNAGVDVGVYFFSQAVSVSEAIEEANFVLSLVKSYDITYPIVIDTEYANEMHTGRADNIDKQTRTAIVKAFCDTVSQRGYEPMIYANKWWLMDALDMNQLKNYDVWLAHYTGATQNNPLANMSDYQGTYTMWQYTDIGRVNGIDTVVDCNVSFKKYN